jgi:uncharacterized protein YggU (UPF0235/DUF167 family)
MSLVTITKNTRGKDSRPISFEGIGRMVTRKVQKESDEEGNSLGKDAEGKLITREVDVEELTHEGVLTSIEEALSLVDSNTEIFLDCFADGFNRRAYRIEADKDELDIYVAHLPEEQRKARKSLIRNLAKQLGFTTSEAADMISGAETAKAE